MGKIETIERLKTTVDANGKKIKEVLEQKNRKIERSNEPDFIKLYIPGCKSLKSLPLPYRQLFISLAVRMSYADPGDEEGGQVIYTARYKEAICEELGWKEDMFNKGLRVLCDAEAIRRVYRGLYQVNPYIAARGQWKKDSKSGRGGVEDLCKEFSIWQKREEAARREAAKTAKGSKAKSPKGAKSVEKGSGAVGSSSKEDYSGLGLEDGLEDSRVKSGAEGGGDSSGTVAGSNDEIGSDISVTSSGSVTDDGDMQLPFN